MRALARYGMNWLRWLDEGLNVLTGGDANETLSSRAGKAARAQQPWACLLCRVLNWISKDHCERSIHPDDGANATLPDA